MPTIEVDNEELAHLTKRRAAVQNFIDYCKKPYPKDEYAAEQQDKRITQMEKELASKWGLYV